MCGGGDVLFFYDPPWNIRRALISRFSFGVVKVMTCMMFCILVLPFSTPSTLPYPVDLPSFSDPPSSQFLIVLRITEKEVQHWVEGVLKEPFPEGMTFAEALKDGTRLCRLINEVQVRVVCGGFGG